MHQQDKRNFQQRFLMGGLLLLSIFFSLTHAHVFLVNLVVFFAVLSLALVGIQEFIALTEMGIDKQAVPTFTPVKSFIVATLLLYLCLTYFFPLFNWPREAGYMLMVFQASTLPIVMHYEKKSFFKVLSPIFLGFIYLLIPLDYIIYFLQQAYLLASKPYTFWLLFLLSVTKASDIGGYIVGKTIGKTPLAPKVSPTKTQEGFYGGLILSLMVTTLFYTLQSQHFYSYTEAIFLGFILSLLGQWGDLTESMIKREIRVKDSNSLPGFGGILDMLDSLIFSTPFLGEYLRLWHDL